MNDNNRWVIIAIIIAITILGFAAIISYAYFFLEVIETPHEKCIDRCYNMNMKDPYKVECINSCNDAVILVIEDLTNSIDNIDWESILREASS